MAQQKTPETQATADIFYLTQLIEDDGSITLLKPQGEGAMAETNDTMENAPETDSVSTTEAVENTSATTEASASPANTAENTSSDSPVAADPNAAAPSSSPSFADTSVTPDAPGDLASLKTLAESAAALSSLTDIARKIQAEGPKVTSGQGVSAQNAGGYTVDGLMRELLKPLLKEWLDAHLPSLVKWLVTEQIEKMLQDQLGVAPSQTKPNPSEATGTAPDSGDSTDEALEAVEAIMDGADADTPPAEEAS